MTGTECQIQLADQIRLRLNQDFDRIANAFLAVAARQSEENRRKTQKIITILEQQRAEIMSNQQAGYFIREWQELDGRVRQLIATAIGNEKHLCE